MSGLTKGQEDYLLQAAELFRACAGSPAAVTHAAGLLKAWVAQHGTKPAKALDARQVEMFAAGATVEQLEDLEVTELDRLRAELAGVREELAKAKHAARQRERRANGKAKRAVENPPEHSTQAHAPQHAPHAPCMHASRSSKKWMPGNARESERADDDEIGEVYDDPEQPPFWAFDDAEQRRPDLSEFAVRDLWRWIAKQPHRSESDARDHFVRVLPKHKDRNARATTPAPAEPPAADVDERPAPVSRATPRVHAPSDELGSTPASPLEALERIEPSDRPTIASGRRATGPPSEARVA